MEYPSSPAVEGRLRRQRERQQAEHSLHAMGFNSVTAEEIGNDRIVMSLEDAKKLVDRLQG